MSSISASTSSAAARALVLAAVAVVAACAAFAPRLVAPEVRAVDVSVIVLDLPRVRLGVDVTLANPNRVDVALTAIDAALDVEGERAAAASLARPVTLAARSDTRVSLDVTGDLAAALAGVARSLSRGRGPLRYEIAGAAIVADGRRIPFRRSGVLAHP